jgi:hypothetical protein
VNPTRKTPSLDFETDAECILQDGGIFIRPLREEPSDLSEESLADLVAQGELKNRQNARFFSGKIPLPLL